MTTQTAQRPPTSARELINKVPEITVWFWVIKILCTTVGESFADWINSSLGVGLINTALIFTVLLAVVLGAQMKSRTYRPVLYWLTVVTVSITGTLYTDILTDSQGVPLWLSSTVFSVLLVAVFGIWYARERTLSIHAIDTPSREGFYWLTVLVTFALGTAVGDWTLDLTGWGPGVAVILPASLIAVVFVGWRMGGQATLAFWLAYILTRPLGANIGDWFATPGKDGGLGVGTALTSVLFLAAIAATVIYLTVSKVDVASVGDKSSSVVSTPGRQKAAVGLYAVATAATAAVLIHASSVPHASALADEAPSSTSSVHLTPAQAIKNFPQQDIAQLRSTVGQLVTDLKGNNQKGAVAMAKELETQWDTKQKTLQPKDPTAWTFFDGEIDKVLTSVRASNPDQKAEISAATDLQTSLAG